MGAIFIFLPSFWVEADFVCVIFILKNAVMLDGPRTFFTYIGLEDRSRETVMVIRREIIAQIMDEGADYPVYIRSAPFGSRSALQAVF